VDKQESKKRALEFIDGLKNLIENGDDILIVNNTLLRNSIDNSIPDSVRIFLMEAVVSFRLINPSFVRFDDFQKGGFIDLPKE